MPKLYFQLKNNTLWNMFVIAHLRASDLFFADRNDILYMRSIYGFMKT